jgi:uncharacterized protein
LTHEIEESLERAETIYLATSSPEGIPNVAPMGAFWLMDKDTLIISDQYMNKTLENLRRNPHAAISYWGAKGGFQIKGSVSIHTGDEVFKRNIEWMKVHLPRLTPKGAILMKITDVYSIKPGPDAGKKLL